MTIFVPMRSNGFNEELMRKNVAQAKEEAEIQSQ